MKSKDAVNKLPNRISRRSTRIRKKSTFEAPKKVVKTKKVTRVVSVSTVIKDYSYKWISIEDFYLFADSDYVAAGGQPNIKESKWYCDMVLNLMDALGYLRRDGNQIFYMPPN